MWISVKDRLPDLDIGRVLVCYLTPFFGLQTEEYDIGHYDDPRYYEDGDGQGWLDWKFGRSIEVTHWQLLDKLPKENI